MKRVLICKYCGMKVEVKRYRCDDVSNYTCARCRKK